jgi:hypothetical protein
MGALTTTLQKIGINGFLQSTMGGHINWSTNCTAVTFTCGDLSKVVIVGLNAGVDDISATITATTAAGYASAGRGNKVLTTAIASSSFFMIAQLESNWFQTTANAFTINFSTALTMVGGYELGSSRVN